MKETDFTSHMRWCLSAVVAHAIFGFLLVSGDKVKGDIGSKFKIKSSRKGITPFHIPPRAGWKRERERVRETRPG